MTQQSDELLNGVLISMARSLLQYVAEAWPWVDPTSQSIEQQVLVIAARQRQDVSDIADLLTDREHYIDFGSFPTEYTDLQFLALETLFNHLHHSQAAVIQTIGSTLPQLQAEGDEAGFQLLTAVETRQNEAAESLRELEAQLKQSAAS